MSYDVTPPFSPDDDNTSGRGTEQNPLNRERERPLESLAPLRIESLGVLMREINSMRRAMIAEVLLEYAEDYAVQHHDNPASPGLTPYEIRLRLAEKLG